MKTWMKVALVLLVVGAVVVWLFVQESDRQARMTAETMATLTSVEFDPDMESSSLDETDLEYAFEAGGQTFAGSDSLPGNLTEELRPGQQVRLCYNPQDPAENDLRRDTRPCGG